MTNPTPDDHPIGWDALADAWAYRVRVRGDIHRTHILDPATLRLLGDVAGLRVLDAGCGEGHFARTLAQRGAQVTGVDLSARMLELAQAEEDRQPLGIRYLQGDLADLSPSTGSGQGLLSDASFDVCVAYLSLMDVERYQDAIQELALVLAPGGRLVCSILHPCFDSLHPQGRAGWERRVPGSRKSSDKLYFKVDDYFAHHAILLEIWRGAGARVSQYHRTLEETCGALFRAGFLLSALQEPRPDPSLLEQDPEEYGDFFRIPPFLLLEARKV